MDIFLQTLSDFINLSWVTQWAALLLTILVHVVFALGVWFDARGRQRQGNFVRYVPSIFWGVATLLGGVWIAGLYWLMHHSALAVPNPPIPGASPSSPDSP